MDAREHLQLDCRNLDRRKIRKFIKRFLGGVFLGDVPIKIQKQNTKQKRYYRFRIALNSNVIYGRSKDTEASILKSESVEN